MKRKLISLTWVPVLAFALGCGGADTGTDEETSPDADVVGNDVDTGPPPDGDTGGGQGPVATDRPQLCEMVTMEDVSAITGGEYAGFEQQADYATLAQCGYIGSAGSVSMVYASGEQVSTRWENVDMLGEVTAIEGFWEGAVWEPVTGTLTAKRDDMLVEIRVSRSHAEDEQGQIELAKQLAELVASQF